MKAGAWIQIAWGAAFAFAAGCSDTEGSPLAASGSAASACEPSGTWLVEWMQSSGGTASGKERVTVALNADGGAPTVVFPDRKPRAQNCEPDAVERFEADASLSDDGCTLTVSLDNEWCYSRERQCERFKLALTIRGDAAQVSGGHGVCTGSSASGALRELSGTARRE
ncbi:MAG: hypothetical protein ABW321_14110 [Polyangiales bacterium]